MQYLSKNVGYVFTLAQSHHDMKSDFLENPVLILASGPSRRMGTHKASLELAGKPLIAHIAEKLMLQTRQIWINSASQYDFLPTCTYISDQFENVGPLGGVEAGLSYLQAHLPAAKGLVSVSCDAPFIPTDMVSRLFPGRSDPSVCRIACSAGRRHWTHACWPLECLEELRLFMNNKNRAVGEFAQNIGFDEVKFEDIQLASGKKLDPFFNVNTPEDLGWAEEVARDIQVNESEKP